MNYTSEPWKLHRGFSDWGMSCQHDIYVGEEGQEHQIAGIPSITPYCLGASEKDRKYAEEQWHNALLIYAAPEMYEAIKRQIENIEKWLETGKPADEEESKSIYDQMVAAINKAEGGDFK